MTMRKLPRDLVLILRTEAKNQRTPPIDYVVAEDGGRMVHRPDPDIAMAELLEEAAAALASERAAHAETKRELDEAFQKYVDANEARIEAEAQRDEALKALEPFARVSSLFDHMNDDGGSVMMNIHLSDLRAARRASEGGNADG